MSDTGGRWDGGNRIGREGFVDSRGARIGRTRARLEVWDQRSAKAMTGRCTWFCGDEQCPQQCAEAER